MIQSKRRVHPLNKKELTVETWQIELDTVASKFDSVVGQRKKTVSEWDKIIKHANEQKEQMYANLKKYNQAIQRAKEEISNIREAARKVLAYKAALERDTQKLLEIQRAEKSE